MKPDTATFALHVLHTIMKPATPLPQVVPSSDGGVQLEWHEKGIDLELHIRAPYDCELWYRDHQDADAEPVSSKLSNDFSDLRTPIDLLTTRRGIGMTVVKVEDTGRSD